MIYQKIKLLKKFAFIKINLIPLHSQFNNRVGNGTNLRAGVAELVDVLDLGSSAARRGGSIPSARTIIKGLTGRRISY